MESSFLEICWRWSSMTSIKKLAVLVAAIGLSCALGLAILFVHAKVTENAVWVSGMGAIVAITALANTVLIFALTDERAQFTNAFAIAKQWNEEPMLGARQTVRPLLRDMDALKSKIKTDPGVTDAIVHYANFFWNLASAVEVKWAQSAYLRLRFRTSLDTFLPLIQEWANSAPDKAAAEAVASLARLQSLWANRPS
jgi:hypothetical protein